MAGLEEVFRNPLPAAKPSCFWWWLNSLVDKEGITRDQEEFKAKGMGGVTLICGSNWGTGPPPYRGPLFLSPEWRELYKHALHKASRLGALSDKERERTRRYLMEKHDLAIYYADA